MSDAIERAEKALEEVSAGPWEQNGNNGVHTGRGKCIALTDGHELLPCGKPVRKANAEFIAAARQLVPELVAELKAARAENERLKNPPRGAIQSWSASYISDPPELNVPIGGTTYTLCPDDASVLHNILGEFLAGCIHNAAVAAEQAAK